MQQKIRLYRWMFSPQRIYAEQDTQKQDKYYKRWHHLSTCQKQQFLMVPILSDQ
jgi:hypothetical protein